MLPYIQFASLLGTSMEEGHFRPLALQKP